MHVAKYLSLIEQSEHELARSCMLVSDRHSREPAISEATRSLAGWSRRRIEELAPQLRKYGSRSANEPARLRSAMFRDPRIGPEGLLRDLQDLCLLMQQAHLSWSALRQASRSLPDLDLGRLSELCASQTRRQLDWRESQLRGIASEALVGPEDRAQEIRDSLLPKHPSPAVFPDPAWAPLAGGLIILAVGVLGLAARQPWLLPSLGPSAYLAAENAPHPSSRGYNIFVGHLIGLGVGFLTVTLLGAWNAPVPFISHVLTPTRVFAGAIAVFGTLLLTVLVRAHHPPAGATTLLVALGPLKTSQDAVTVIVSAAIVAVLSEALRELRIGRLRELAAPERPPLTTPEARSATSAV